MTPINLWHPSDCCEKYEHSGYKSCQSSQHTLSTIVFIKSVFIIYSCYFQFQCIFNTALYYFYDLFFKMMTHGIMLPYVKMTPQNQTWFWKWPTPHQNGQPSLTGNKINDQTLYDVSWFNWLNRKIKIRISKRSVDQELQGRFKNMHHFYKSLYNNLLDLSLA